jgi:hypothetical protein
LKAGRNPAFKGILWHAQERLVRSRALMRVMSVAQHLKKKKRLILKKYNIKIKIKIKARAHRPGF